MPPDPHLTVVLDPDDDPGFSDDLDRRADLTTGVAVVRPVPGVADTRRLAADVLIAMGKHYDALTREHQNGRAWELTRLWTQAENIRHLVVCDAQRLPPELWDELATITAGAGRRLWMIVRDEPGGPEPRAAARCGPDDLASKLPVPTVTDEAAFDDRVLLPQESFLTFRWACSRRLSPEQFAQVDAVYLETYQATTSWLQCRRWRDRPTRQEVVGQLRALTSTSRSSTETVVRLRAAQAAYFCDGVLLHLDNTRLAQQPDVPATGLNPPVAMRLRRLVTPAWACALALTHAGRMNTKTLARLQVGDLRDDGQLLTVGDQRIDVPAHAAGVVRAQLLVRRQAGAGDADPLLTHAGQAINTATLGRRLDNAARLVAVWRPEDERRPPWHPAPTLGHTVDLVPLERNWETPASA